MAGDSNDLGHRIRERAYFLWLHAGKPDGFAPEFWNAARSAEQIVSTISAEVPARWPDVSPSIVKEDNAKIMLERADALIKAQDEGMRAMEGRMASLLGISVTLASAAVAATVTAASSNANLASFPTWVQPWTVPTLCLLAFAWLLAIWTAAFAMLSRKWAVPGTSPRNLFRADYLSGNANRLRLLIARALQNTIAENAKTIEGYSRKLNAVVMLLAAGPLIGLLIGLWFSRAFWMQLIVNAIEVFAHK